MYQLTYSSTARPDCSQKDILDILKESQKNNKTLDLSGCLVYHKNSFVQILEGSKKDLNYTFDKIKKDIRHYDVKLLWMGSSEKRIFKSWNMAFCSLDEKMIHREELIQFEKNLLMLSSFTKSPSAAVGLFWTSVRKLIANDPITEAMDTI